MKNQQGFTLVELVVVIVILGILAAVAVPKFIDMRSDAERSVVESFVGALHSAHTLALSKLLVCGYRYTGGSNLHWSNFLQYNDQEPMPGQTCNSFVNSLGYGGQGNVIGLNGIRNSIFQDPTQGAWTWIAGTGSAVQFTSKTGRTITIWQGGVYPNMEASFYWTASPAY